MLTYGIPHEFVLRQSVQSTYHTATHLFFGVFFFRESSEGTLLFMFLSLSRLCVCVFLCSHWSLVDVPLIFFCPADHVPDWQPRVLLGMVEARSVNVKKTTTTTTTYFNRHSS